MDKITLDRIKLLHPSLREEANKIYADICAAMPAGVVCRFTHTLRTFAEQDALYQLGRSKPGKVVTNAKGGQSFHNYGLAIDFVLLVNGSVSWTVDKNWLAVISIFESYGWESGHHWKFKDSPHLQKTFGKTTAQLLATGKQYPDL
jgi:peptidoglycan L-alanyl-D-glutamate endopeptidase CwlK